LVPERAQHAGFQTPAEKSEEECPRKKEKGIRISGMSKTSFLGGKGGWGKKRVKATLLAYLESQKRG